MDSMDLEKEKGITIRAKNASVTWKEVTINIVDTPGHADFAGEVERILNMVDGVLLIVDAAEGPQAQTRFVLRKAIEQDLSLIVVVNKIDRDLANPRKAHDSILELLLELNASEKQFNAPFLYASAKMGYALKSLDDAAENMNPLLDTIIEHIPAPQVNTELPFLMLISNLDWNEYVGRIAIGKIIQGTITAGNTIFHIDKNQNLSRLLTTKVFSFSGLRTSESIVGEAGNIIGLAGGDGVFIGDTLSGLETQSPLPFVPIGPPTIQMQIGVNDGPLAGREGKFLTARHIRERLIKETRTNISLEIADSDSANLFIVKARGVLQISILAETMRREGYELLISQPEVIYQEKKGVKEEPFETLWVDIPNQSLGDIMQNLALRKAEITNLEHCGERVKLTAIIPTRGIIGFESFIANKTSGRGICSHLFYDYDEMAGEIRMRNTGAMVSMENGIATYYALEMLQERGRLFIGPQDEVYKGMVIGENSRLEDLQVNPTRLKHLTNVRSQGEGKTIPLEPPMKMSLEKIIEYIAADEYVEITRSTLRIRKKILDATKRKRASLAIV
jgi:GTP-binding protein